MARIANAMEARARKADSVQAEALEKLGGEIARIAERLSERITSAEKRSAQANESLAGQVVEIGDKIAKRHDQAQSELADRIRQSEERTAKLLDEARARIDQKLAEAAPRAVAAPPPSPGPSPESLLPPSLRQAPPPPALDLEEPFVRAAPPAPEPVEPEATPEPPRRRFGADVFKAGASAKPASTFAADEVVDPFSDDPFVAGDAAFPSNSSPFDPSDDFALPPPPVADTAPEPPLAAAPRSGFSVRDFAPAAEESGPSSTRSLIEAARAAARQASQGGGESRSRRSVDALAPSTPPSPELEPAGEATANRPFGINFPKRKKKDAGPTLRTMVLASGTAAALTMAAVGTALIYAPQDQAAGRRSKTQADERPAVQADLTPSASPYGGAASDAAPVPEDDPTLAVALSPAAAAPAGESPRLLFTTAASRIEHGDRSGLADLRHAANLGYAPAQVYLAELYQAGNAGLAKDMAEARRWTERAAHSGDAHAMYNLASYYYNGEGGPRDPATAATWFRKAAELGVVNSQYNLAQLYQKGYGVPQNLAEAYKWYLVAAASGDSESRADAESLKGQLTPEARAAAERSAASLHLRGDPTPHTSVASAQALR
jgi:localization factor PodJL